MADISKEDLRKEIAAILKDADLSSTSAKKVRQELEEKLEANLQSRKKEIDDLVMEFVNSEQGKKKKGKNSESEPEEEEEEEEEESEEEKKEKRASTGKKPPAKKAKKSSEDESASEQSEGDSEEEYSPKKSKPIKTRKLPPKKKKGSESDSDSDWAKSKKSKKGNSSEGETVNDFNYELITAFRDSKIPLATLDHPLLKKFFSKYCGREIPDFATLIEQYGEFDLDSSDCDGEENTTYSNHEMVDILRCYFICNENSTKARSFYSETYPTRKVPDVRTFVSIVQRLQDFGTLIPHTEDYGREQTRRIKQIAPRIVSAFEENPKISMNKLSAMFNVSTTTVARALRGHKGVGGGVKKGGSGYTKTLTLSPELAALVGKESMARHEVVQKVWAIIKEKDLYDPKNKQYAICDDALMKVIGVKRFRTFGMMKYLKNHFIS